MQGVGAAQFQATVVNKLPLVATDAAVFAVGAELGWRPTWLNRRAAAPTPSAAAVGSSDIATMLNQPPVVPPPAGVVGEPAVATPLPRAVATSPDGAAEVTW